MRFKKFLFYSFILLLLVVSVIGYLSYCAAFVPNIKENSNKELYVFPNETEVALGIKMDSILIDTSAFVRLSKLMNLKRLRPGRYLFPKNCNNYTIISKLRSGNQDAVNVTINNVRDIFQLSGKLGATLLLDSMDFVDLLTDTMALQKINYNRNNILCLFIPNTYQMYWTISADKFIQRMLHENEVFWTKENRSVKAQQKSLTPEEVYTIASIVEKETIYEPEKGMVAGVYINRLRAGMKLQADPTVVFAMGLTGIQRVLLQHLKIDSPYNTYLIDGLPPGPIWMPSTGTIDSVLNAADHEYLFFCAKPGYDGSHAFSISLQGHAQNANAYRRWLDKERIR